MFGIVCREIHLHHATNEIEGLGQQRFCYVCKGDQAYVGSFRRSFDLLFPVFGLTSLIGWRWDQHEA